MIPLYKPFVPELPNLNEILYSGNLAYGNYGRLFENELSKYIGNTNILVTNTFNMAILVAITTLDIKSGDSIIASPMACLASTQPFLSQGIKVIWSDVDPKTGTLCPYSLRRKIKESTPKAILHNHFCGYVGYVNEINSIGKENGIPIIDDSIEAFGSEYNNLKMGNLDSDLTIFSFGPVRIPNIIDGGAIVFKNKYLYDKAILVRDAGIDRRYFRDQIGEINPLYDIKIVGHSATIDEVRSYIGLQQMKNVNWIIDKQRNNALYWDEKIIDFPDAKSLKITNGLPNYWIYGIEAKNKRETILKFRDMGYYASGVHINNNIYSAFGDKTTLLGVDEFYNKFVALPCGWWL